MSPKGDLVDTTMDDLIIEWSMIDHPREKKERIKDAAPEIIEAIKAGDPDGAYEMGVKVGIPGDVMKRILQSEAAFYTFRVKTLRRMKVVDATLDVEGKRIGIPIEVLDCW